MKKYTSSEIIGILAKEITQGSLKANDRLPSEQQLIIKYNISRAITNKVFSELKKLGLIYSKAHKGFFVAEDFMGITSPYHFKYHIDKIENKESEPSPQIIDFASEIPQPLKGKTFIKEMFKNDELVLKEEVWVNDEALNFKFLKHISVTDQLSEHSNLESVSVKGHFEDDNTFGKSEQMVEYKVFYSNDSILAITRAVIKHSEIHYHKKEYPVPLA